jgi:uncharacterized protein YecT (DUF1311 family)
MFRILTLFFVLTAYETLHAQLEDKQLDSLRSVWRAELQQEAIDKYIGVVDSSFSNAFSDSIFAAYQLDTFIVEGIYSRQLEVDQTTYGMNRASRDCEEAYDQLLNKYYQILLKKLNKEDQKQLVAAQRAWLKFRDIERQVNAALIKSQYSGGGSIQQLIYASQHLYITRTRVNELVGYLTRIL